MGRVCFGLRCLDTVGQTKQLSFDHRINLREYPQCLDVMTNVKGDLSI